MHYVEIASSEKLYFQVCLSLVRSTGLPTSPKKAFFQIKLKLMTANCLTTLYNWRWSAVEMSICKHFIRFAKISHKMSLARLLAIEELRRQKIRKEI